MTSSNNRLFCLPQLVGLIGAVCGCFVAVPGCSSKKPQQANVKLTSRYESLPPREVPPYLKDSILERCDLYNSAPFPVSGFGLVANLRGSGDTFSGTPVRSYILTTMIKRGFGSKLLPEYQSMQPEDVLKDPRFAIIRVDGLLPPGAHKYQRFDLFVNAMDGNNTSSLAHGDLYRTDLKVNGANVQAPGYAIDIWGQAEGSIFVNPAYALMSNASSPEARASLRQGVIPGGAIAMQDRPIILRLRQPQLSMTRAMEYRIDQAFQDPTASSARDEALIALYVPQKYGTDWEHYTEVVRHLFLSYSPDFAVTKAKQLAEEALKPDAPLLDISYCWEALGPAALPFIAPLMTSDKPEVAFAAARAAVFLGDGAAENVLMGMAKTESNPFQIPAVQTLAKMQATPEINQMLRTLLNVDQSLVRIEAYKALAANGDQSIISRKIVRSNGDDSFILDIVPSSGPPVIYATRSGLPRIAVIGNKPKMTTPVIFMAMDNHLSINADPDRPSVLSIFHRGQELPKPVSTQCSPLVEELIARLGGEGPPGEPRLNFNYCEVVALLQLLSDQHLLYANHSGLGGKRVLVAFILQDPPHIRREIEEAPMIAEQQGPAPEKVGTADSGMNGVGNEPAKFR